MHHVSKGITVLLYLVCNCETSSGNTASGSGGSLSKAGIKISYRIKIVKITEFFMD